MAQPAEDRRKLLYDSYLAVPPHLHAEIVRGTLHVMPRPSPRHASASSVLGGRLNGPFQLGDGGPGARWREARHYRANDRARIAPFEAIELDLSLLWSSPRRS